MASDPQDDPIGTVRHGAAGRVAVRTGMGHGDNWIMINGDPDVPCWMLPREVGDWPIVGAVPGTPAAQPVDRDELASWPVSCTRSPGGSRE
jgi:hypothetical protein